MRKRFNRINIKGIKFYSWDNGEETKVYTQDLKNFFPDVSRSVMYKFFKWKRQDCTPEQKAAYCKAMKKTYPRLSLISIPDAILACEYFEKKSEKKEPWQLSILKNRDDLPILKRLDSSDSETECGSEFNNNSDFVHDDQNKSKHIDEGSMGYVDVDDSELTDEDNSQLINELNSKHTDVAHSESTSKDESKLTNGRNSERESKSRSPTGKQFIIESIRLQMELDHIIENAETKLIHLKQFKEKLHQAFSKCLKDN